VSEFVLRYGVFDINNAINPIQFAETRFEAKSIRSAKLRANKIVADCPRMSEYNMKITGWRDWENPGAAFDHFSDNPVMYSERFSKMKFKSKTNTIWQGYIRIFWRKNSLS